MLKGSCTNMTRNITKCLLISFCVMMIACANNNRCNEVVHTISVPSFNEEQRSIIYRFKDSVYAMISDAETYFFYRAEKKKDGEYLLEIYKLSMLQSYYQSGDCGGLMAVDGGIWFIFNEDGKLAKTNFNTATGKQAEKE